MPKPAGADQSLDDVQVLGVWNFTLQSDTPLYWLRCGALEKYLLKFRVRMPHPATCGIVLHAEVDGLGTDGASFWIERRAPRVGGEGTKRYLLSGEGLESKAIVTRSFPDAGGEFEEDIEVLMQGYQGTIFLQNRAVKVSFRCKSSKGSIAFYNSTNGEVDDVTFSGVRITALRRGPMEIGGVLGKREISLHTMTAKGAVQEDMGTRARPSGSFQGGFGDDAYTSPAAVRRRGSDSTSPWGNSVTAAPKARLRSSASDGVLRKSGKSIGLSPTSSLVGTGGKQKWKAVALAAPTSEQALLKAAPQQAAPRGACEDFIAM